ncbi:hydroxyisourate hydrolase [Paraburkholderia susongensis]|uniref:hydroxyisourate hydrolase n=1 Tax=Paraburkholderia susongensis TaxID=1515439 RepID=A0A1X7JGS6_9BURK|nr:hydroxyisourate hydrolase [Paraburkholderia susongensis]SMG26751.1 5-hydroxyisourate hydrolase [Paraburkholderia susongensis]
MNNISKPNRRRFVVTSMTMAGGMLLSRQALSSQAAALGNGAAQPAQSADPISQHGASPRLTIHILDSWHGAPATGLQVEFARIENERRQPIRTVIINQNGRADEPLLIGDTYRAGDYELLLHIDSYYRTKGVRLPSPSFLSQVPIRFSVNSAAERLHLPVQFGPWNYSYYRGS